MEDERKSSVEFLLYSYFKIDLNATKAEIIKSAIEKAYTDATNQGAYNTKIKTFDKEKSIQAKGNAETIINTFIEKALLENDYDKLHKKVCNELIKNYNGLPFTYGNAQKWVNMTMKNLYMISLLICGYCVSNDKETIQFCNNICEISSKFHVPIDSYIIEKIWDTDVTLPIIKLLKGGKRGIYTSEKVIGWSNWNEEQYEKCQLSLRKYIEKLFNGVKPIEWESMAWIEIAKKRSSK